MVGAKRKHRSIFSAKRLVSTQKAPAAGVFDGHAGGAHACASTAGGSKAIKAIKYQGETRNLLAFQSQLAALGPSPRHARPSIPPRV